MTQRDPSQPSQQAIREAVEAIRTWYYTICHDLCIEPPKVEIRKPTHSAIYNMPASGRYDPNIKTVTIFALRAGMPLEYLYTLAHELRHAHQHQYNIAPTERDSEEYERYFAQRFKNGPEAGRYEGPIEGLSVIVKCNRCGRRMDAMDGRTCSQCRREEAEAERRKEARRAAEPMRCAGCGRLIDRCEGGLCWECLRPPEPHGRPDSDRPKTSAHRTRVRSSHAPAAKTSLLERLTAAFEERQRARKKREAEEAHQYWLQGIDNHPANGQSGWWAVEEAYYVFAASAGEAIIKVGDQPMSHCPSVRFLGRELPTDIKRRAGIH